MTKIKLMLLVAMLAMMVAGAGPAAFAQPQQPEPRILGGTAVPNGKYPFVAALLDERKGEPENARTQHMCGGTLIDSDSVLTAAHCVDGIFPTKLSVVVGRAQLSSNQGQVREVVRMYIPDGYNYNAPSKNDVAVLSLKSPVEGITPVRLPLSTDNWYEQPGKVQTVVGRGRTVSEGTGAPDRMQEVKVPVVSDADAAKLSSNFIPELMIAAGEKGKDTCKGDSGGPLFAQFIRRLGRPPPGTTPPPNPPYQYGITSFGEDVCATNPAVYTEVNAPEIRKFITCRQLTTPNHTPTYCWTVYK